MCITHTYMALRGKKVAYFGFQQRAFCWKSIKKVLLKSQIAFANRKACWLFITSWWKDRLDLVNWNLSLAKVNYQTKMKKTTTIWTEWKYFCMIIFGLVDKVVTSQNSMAGDRMILSPSPTSSQTNQLEGVKANEKQHPTS